MRGSWVFFSVFEAVEKFTLTYACAFLNGLYNDYEAFWETHDCVFGWSSSFLCTNWRSKENQIRAKFWDGMGWDGMVFVFFYWFSLIEFDTLTPWRFQMGLDGFTIISRASIDK